MSSKKKTITVTLPSKKTAGICGACLAGVILVIAGVMLVMHSINSNLAEQLPGHTFRVEQISAQTPPMPKAAQPRTTFTKHTMTTRAPNNEVTKVKAHLTHKDLVTRHEEVVPGRKSPEKITQAFKLLSAKRHIYVLEPAYSVIRGSKHNVPKTQAKTMKIQLTRVK